jgi:protein-L-isoaspartate(D-aspartate) O-methyltransferase
VTAGGSSLPEVQRLLAVLAAGRRCAEAGTAFGEGAAAMAETASSVVTVELDPERAQLARDRLAGLPNVELLDGDWRERLPPLAPFDLVFLDGGA